MITYHAPDKKVPKKTQIAFEGQSSRVIKFGYFLFVFTAFTVRRVKKLWQRFEQI